MNSDKKKISGYIKHKRFIQAVCVFLVAFCFYYFAPQSMSEASKRVFFVFICSALFWAFEIIPLYATSLSTVLLLTFLLCRPGGVLQMDEMGYTIFMLPFGSSIIMLFFGGLVMAVALRKYSIDKYIASNMLKYFGTQPYWILFGFMASTAFLSMWMSNTATTAMMIAMLAPLIRQMDAADPFRTGLILSIPFAANIGGIATPIGTPPNAIAIGILANYGIQVKFLAWMKMALPLSAIILFIVSILLISMYPSRSKNIQFQVEDIKPIDRQSRLVCVIAVFTVVLWLTSEIHKIPAALIALLAAGLFSATGLLSRDDFKSIDWDVLVLMWGGLSLGKALEISGLSQWIVTQPMFDHTGFFLVAVFSILAIIMSTFVSNTATATLIIPVAVAIPGENHIMLVTMIALSCSFAMALPISTPPNAIAFSSQMLKSKDMLKVGALVSVIGFVLIILGYQWILPIVF